MITYVKGIVTKKYDNPLIIIIKVSVFLGGLLAMSHIGVGLLIWMLPWPVWVRMVLTIGLMLSLYREVRRHALRQGPKAITALEIDTDGDYSLRVGQGDWTPCQFVESFRSEWLVIVRLNIGDRRWPVSVLLARDAVDPTLLRELRARLNLQVSAGDSPVRNPLHSTYRVPGADKTSRG